MPHPDICIAGAGIIGLSLALELDRRGARVAVFDRGEPLAEASTAAAGMLAVNDPENPAELTELSRLSLSLYPEFFDRIFHLTGIPVQLHTSTTLQALGPHGHSGNLPVLSAGTLGLLVPQLRADGRQFLLLNEHSLDPRELATALLAAVRATSIELHRHTPIRLSHSSSGALEIHAGDSMPSPARFVDCTGAWSLTDAASPHLRVYPKKGQMLAVALPRSLPLHLVIRTPDIYIVPRTAEEGATRAIIGATVEDAGFDKTVHPADIARLRSLAAELLPPLADAEELDAWAGLRPTTVDGLPLLGQVAPDHFIATGHYRNGILLAPGTARVMAQLLAGESTTVDLICFSPLRKSR